MITLERKWTVSVAPLEPSVFVLLVLHICGRVADNGWRWPLPAVEIVVMNHPNDHEKGNVWVIDDELEIDGDLWIAGGGVA